MPLSSPLLSLSSPKLSLFFLYPITQLFNSIVLVSIFILFYLSFCLIDYFTFRFNSHFPKLRYDMMNASEFEIVHALPPLHPYCFRFFSPV